MNLQSQEQYIVSGPVINFAVADHEPMVELSRSEAAELEINPHVRFERLWEQGKLILEVDDDRGGIVEARGQTETGIPFSVKLTFRTDAIKPEFATGMMVCFDNRRVIEAQWSDNGVPLEPLEIIKETETELDTKSNELFSANISHNLLLVEQSIMAYQYLRAQHIHTEQPDQFLLKGARI